MAITLERIAGFADVPDSVFNHDVRATGLNVSRVSQNAQFGMVRMEVFSGFYKHGDQVLLPVSTLDSYPYQLEELNFMWAVQDTRNPSTGWITGPDSLWFAAWNVEQTTGKVEAIEYYRRSGNNDQSAQSNDGILQVFTIGQRQKTALIMTDEASNYVDVADSFLATDKAFIESVAKGMSRNAKFGVVNNEMVYMGEFKNGDTIPQPVSPADGHTYAYADCIFQHSLRWTTSNTSFTQPDKSQGQLGPIKVAINGTTGAVSVSVAYITDTLTTFTSHGRIAVFAFCSRAAGIDTIPAVANDFAELGLDVFMPGESLRASSLLQLNSNLRESAVSPERFGPTDYQNGNTVPTPTSAIDGYAYSRQEMRCIWEWVDTSPQTGSNLRTAGFYATISDTTGAVSITTWRLPPGGPYDPTHSFAKIRVTVFAQRGATHPTLTPGSATNTPGDIGSTTTDVNGPDKAPYAFPYWPGSDSGTPTASQRILRHPIGGGDIASVLLPSGLTGSYWGCVTAPTGSYVITIKKGATTLGTINIAAGATTATFTFSSPATLVPGDILDLFAPASPDATIAGLYGVIVGTRS